MKQPLDMNHAANAPRAALPPAARSVHAASWRRLRWVIVLVLAAIGATAILVFATPLVVWLTPAKAGSYDPVPGDTLIVLAAGSLGDAPDVESTWRAVYAARFYRSGLYQRVLVVGGSPRPGTPAISALMAALMESLGVPRGQIELEEQSQNTHENALFVARLSRVKNFGRMVLLTSDYHSRRACDAFRNAGLNITPLPVPYATKLAARRAMRPMVLELALRERVARLVYMVRGWN